ncbi:hypothetical protein GCM10022236_33750 [Microlunatus ginsengisoli]|uniref:Glycosyl hydrolases family 16 n=1 Tax=Microlunatus ginsengisoli TaxID=363863 RepID=A0ABP7AB98_9ACTN
MSAVTAATTGDPLPAPPDRAPDLADDFATGPRSELWVGHYLPHWTTPDRSAARTGPTEDGLRLRIDEDQPDWRPEDAPMRVSNLATGTFSGPLGSTRGTHRHRDDGLTVRTPTPTRLLWAPSAGRVDLTVSATRDAGCMLAGWLVGTEHGGEQDSGEVCVFEIDASAIGTHTVARTGLKAHHDPRLVTDMTEVVLPFDATRPHTWTAIWGAGRTLIGCEGTVVRRIEQASAYPLFLMLDLFEIGPPGGSYPKSALLHRVRGWTLG